MPLSKKGRILKAQSYVKLKKSPRAIRLLVSGFLTITLVVVSAFVPPQGGKKYGIHTVVIDAGHGGHDTGCIGGSAKEKDVALAIALRLGAYIENNFSDVKVIYTRKSDVFVELNKRAEIANSNKADLFICVHCNDGPKSAFGTETWVMGLHKTEDNLNVAKRENASILMEYNYKSKYDGYDISSPESNIVFSLYQSAFMDQSLNLAAKVQKYLKDQGGRSSRGVKQAGFLVLYKTSMPSVLIETGFLTNSTEEKYMNTAKGQDVIASSIFRAFKDYKAEIEGHSLAGDNSLLSSPEKKPSNKNNNTNPLVPNTAQPIAVTKTPVAAPTPTITTTTTPTVVNSQNTENTKKEKKEKPIDAEALQRAADKAEFEKNRRNKQQQDIQQTGDTKAKAEAEERLKIELTFDEKERQERIKKEAEEKARKEYEEEQRKKKEAFETKVNAEVTRLKKLEEVRKVREAQGEKDLVDIEEKYGKEAAEKAKQREIARQKAIEQHEARVVDEMNRMRQNVRDSLARAEQEEKTYLEAVEYAKLKGIKPPRRKRKPVQQPAIVIDSTKIKKPDAEALLRKSDRVERETERQQRTQEENARVAAALKAQQEAEEIAQIREDARRRLEEELAKEKSEKNQLQDKKGKKSKEKLFAKNSEASENKELDKHGKRKSDADDNVTKQAPPQIIAGVPLIDKNGTFFTIQIAAASKPIKADSSVLKNATDVKVEKNLDGNYKYMVGRTTSFAEAVLLQRNMRKVGYNDAFMIAFENGKRVGVQEARNILEVTQRAIAAQQQIPQPVLDTLPRTPAVKSKSLETNTSKNKKLILVDNPIPISSNINNPAAASGDFSEQFKTKAEIRGMHYRIQIAVSEKPVPVTSPIFNHTKREIYREIGIDGVYRYTVGPYTTLKQANMALSSLRIEGFKDGFIVAYNNEKRVSLPEESEERRKKKK